MGEKKHLDEKDVRKLISTNRKDLQPFFEMVDAFNLMFGNLLSERVLGIKVRTKILLIPDLTFNLSARQKPQKRIGLNLGVIPLTQALVSNVSKLKFVCKDIPFDKSFDQEKAVNNIADIFNAFYYRMDNYELEDNHISELLDVSDLGLRNNLAYSLFKKTFYFLLLHEYAHLQCRHSSRMKQKSVCEFNVNPNEQGECNESDIIKRQWSELEADHLGADLMIEMLKIIDYPIPEQKPRLINENEAKELRQVIFIIGLLFLLFSYHPNEETSIASYRKGTHPHPCVRMVNLFDVLANYISAAYLIDMQSICDVMSDALVMLITLSRTLGIQEFDVIETSLDEIRTELSYLQSNVGKSWIDTSNHFIIETIVRVRKGIALV